MRSASSLMRPLTGSLLVKTSARRPVVSYLSQRESIRVYSTISNDLSLALWVINAPTFSETTGWRNWLQRTTTSIREEEEGDQEDASFSRKAADSIGPGQPAQPDLQAETQRLPSAV